ncbi:unnamed protein product [Bemisia tabaci]|uniref:Paramyosin n=1 Tax=Bemisia tabaci TaxID=7038 RepID=A0A9P0AHT2_BEMTA|nr:unnamed protein product [Bemisia tabaci]
MGQKKIEIEEKWHHPPTSIYEDNYGYLANYYQPMLDYMDARDRGAPRGEYPHLPWTNERGRDQYRPSNKIQKYPTAELNALAVEAERAAQRNLKHVPVGIKSSDFAKIKTVQASRLSEHIRLASVDKEIKDSLARRSLRTRANSESRMADYELSVPLSSLARKPQILHNVSKIKSIASIKNQFLFETNRNLNKDNVDIKVGDYWGRQGYYADEAIKYHGTVQDKRLGFTSQNYVTDDVKYVRPIQSLQRELTGFENKATHLFDENSKQTSIEIEQLNARVVEAETKLKTEVTRIKKKLQATITDLELSLDVANKNNLELQKVVKKQSLQLTELQAHYDEIQRQLAVTLDQLAVSTRKNQSLTAELEEIRGNYDNARRSQRQASDDFGKKYYSYLHT